MQPGRGRRRGAAEDGRHADHHSEPEPVPAGQREDDLHRSLLDGRRRALPGRQGCHGPDGPPGSHQPRLRRRPRGDGRDGQGDDGHGRGRRARIARSRPRRRRSPTRFWTRFRCVARKGVLINITGGYDLTLFELDEAANRIREEMDPDANIIVGSTLDPSMEGDDAGARRRHRASTRPRRRPRCRCRAGRWRVRWSSPRVSRSRCVRPRSSPRRSRGGSRSRSRLRGASPSRCGTAGARTRGGAVAVRRLRAVARGPRGRADV